MTVRITVDSLIERTAASLLTDPSDPNEEYDRALLEMVMRLEGLDESDVLSRAAVERRLRRIASEHYGHPMSIEDHAPTCDSGPHHQGPCR